MVVGQASQVVECAPGIVGTVTTGAEEAVQGVDDEQPGVGSLKGVFKHGYVTKAQRGGWRIGQSRRRGRRAARRGARDHPRGGQTAGGGARRLVPREAYRQVQGSVQLLPEGAAGSRPRLRAAAMARATQVFPEPGSPERTERAPAARRSFQSQSMGRGSMSARQTRSAWRPATGGVSSLKEGSGGCRMPAEAEVPGLGLVSWVISRVVYWLISRVGVKRVTRQICASETLFEEGHAGSPCLLCFTGDGAVPRCDL